MKRRSLRMGFAGLFAGLVAACSPLGTFDRLVPKDRGGTIVAKGLAYGSDPRQQLDVYVPRGGCGQPRPVVVFFYGGGWNSGTRAGYAFVGRALAAQGFLTIIPDYRLVPEVHYPAFVEDGAAAVRWAAMNAGKYCGDGRSVVVMGHSAGAYIAAMLAVDPRWLRGTRAAVRGFVGLAGPYDFAPFDVDASRAAFGQASDPAETQPVTWASAGDPPALLLYGTDDTVVLPRNSIALAARLRAGGVAVEQRAYRKLGHVGILLALARPFRGRAPVLADVATFIRSTANPNGTAIP
ncbi:MULTISPECIES: alpha/beta hydrolase [unclassified Sphingomonas]|uniref:alpha/beta hydrolase n=1 Tax=unclassified Sphingomonas TaxID=196159 RepID=UPI0006F4B0BB|nr:MULTISPECIES: alpha/beta hydrolase [unclassified Sphingomonas]KQM66291.1 alpha/beta hydrolase [Sphingomonas sp. Leaf16]KQN08747.1 alpha/beta hydrolase [Sphingomonas sp. Leaf29]KQN17328.1 alpha/beta hydrolase [Sphingomonas sp. Leaf32]